MPGNFLQFPEVAEQAFGNRASEFMETFSLGKQTLQVQHELSTGSKFEASIEKIKTLNQGRF